MNKVDEIVEDTSSDCLMCDAKPLLREDKSNIMHLNCCGACLCNPCIGITKKRTTETGLQWSCPQCGRSPAYNDKEDFERALLKAKEGYAWAELTVGLYYRTGFGVTRSSFKSYEYLSLSAQQGDPIAQNWVGLCYRNGDGVKRSEDSAFKYFLKAAEQDLPNAQYSVALCYQNGTGVGKSKENAFHWYYRAADNDHLEGQYNLALYFVNGWGVEQNYEKGYSYFMKTAEKGYKPGQFNVAACFANGEGTEKSDAKAAIWLQKVLVDNKDVKLCSMARDLLNKTQLKDEASSIPEVPVKKERDEDSNYIKKSNVKAIFYYRQCVSQCERDNMKGKIYYNAKKCVGELLLAASKVCGQCGERKKKLTLQCSRCTSVFYCNRECQTLAWKAHKEECQKSSS